MKAKEVILFDELFGTELESRMRKLQEEFNEVVEAFNEYKEFPCYLMKSKLIDEFADLYAVLIHSASLLGQTPEQLSLNSFEKVVKRINNPNYKRGKS